VIRLDTATEDPQGQPALSTAALATVVGQAATQAALGVRWKGRFRTLRFGAQLDVRPIDDVSGRSVAAYLAKYVTKSVGDFGLGARRLHSGVIDQLEVSDHVRRVLHTIVQVAQDPEHREAGAWLHTLGYRGHVTSKTRRYSTTFGELRGRREAWKAQQRATGVEPTGFVPEPVAPEWRYLGCGHASEAERLLAVSAALRNREMRQAARDVLSDED
jgi:hypothetical protein